MAPEALRHNQYSSKSDVWAIGVIAYELVAGTQPWRSPSDSILYEKMRSEPIDGIIEANIGHLGQDYKQFIRACLQFDR